jgi:thiamine biosynthesis lipoprotein
MGTTAHVVVVGGPPDAADRARARIAELEAHWSRFRPDSDISRLNTHPGRPVLVSRDTITAISNAIHAWRTTRGRYDPTILTALERAGYDRDFDDVAPDDPRTTAAVVPAPGCTGIEIDPVVGAVTLPVGTRLDLGGIGKGLAADLVTTELLAAGADGACVNLGGDLRAEGTPPPGAAGWTVGVADAPGHVLALVHGGVATSSRLRRRWVRAGRELHHLVDPATGTPARSGLASVTVIASRAAGAEVLTKVAFLAGPSVGPMLTRAGATGLLIHDDGTVEVLPGARELLR